MLLNEQTLRSLIAQGLGVAQIAQEMSTTPSRVRRSAAVHGVEILRPSQRQDRALALAAEGLHVAEIARQTGYSHRGVTLLLKRHGITATRGGWILKGPQDKGRAERMASMYRQGLTLEKIGSTFDMTRERVRQILKKHGVTGPDGGACKTAKVKAAAKQIQQDARYLAKYGMPYAQYRQWMKAGIVAAYRSQNNAAKQRGIEWGLNFAQWLEIWQTSGKLEERGRGKGKYVMSRIKDTGGYVFGNVHIQLATANSLEAVEKWRGKTKVNRGVFCLYPGSQHPYVVRVGRKQVGRYGTEQEAAEARRAFIEAQPSPSLPLSIQSL